MELNIPSNGGNKIPNCIMCGSVFSPKIDLSLLDLRASYICIEKDHENVGWGRPNLVHNVEEIMLEAILKGEMIGRAKKTKHSNLGLCKILAEHDGHLKTTFK
jgi:hypothetical protein